MADPATDSALARLVRWEDAGGAWRVEERNENGVTLALLRCDGGELLERLVTADADVLALIGSRLGSED
jgi:hypothetical protein